MKPVCIPCRRFFRPLKTGYYFVEGKPNEHGARPGLVDADKWGPYKLWAGDLWRCEGCGAEIIAGFAASPTAEHFHTDFETIRATLGADVQINDC